ncbi:Fic family protein [Pseudokineococcus basanitobsidens]|uniref:Fic family protein n=1 Tax=Pseudokineococcus basanitobsidens TaxID=1926649 RepID=A0ABU8RKK5_9ACTN
MRSFDAQTRLIATVPGDVVRLTSTVDRGQGQEALHVAQLPGLLEQLAFRARVQSVKASSALEGVVVPDDRRADRIIAGSATTLRTRDESELAGYRDALDYLWVDDWRPLNVGLVLHLHRLLLQRTTATGGALKTSDNLVVDRLPDGTRRVRFHPVSAQATPYFLDELVGRFRDERERDVHHPLLLTGLFVLDLLVIHPFDDGNGRVARILTNALLADVGYGVARYVSLEQLIADTSTDYYAALLASTHGWHEGEHDPWPWLRYFAGTVARSYELFAQRAGSSREAGGKRDRVKRYVLEQAPTTFSIADIRTALPGISDGTIRNALDDLRAEERVASDGTGRSATWTRR